MPFGEVFLEEKNAKWNTPYLFTSKELDRETGLYYYGARYQDPKLGIFISVDPLAEKFCGYSSYNYTLNNPVNLIDPDGKSATPPNEFDENGNKISNLGGEKVDFYHQKDGSIKIVDCETGKSNTIKSGQDVIKGFEHRDENVNVNWETIYNEFKIGNGPKRSLMDGSHPMTKAMFDSQAASIARDMYVSNGGKNGYKAFDFGVSGAVKSGTNMTEQMIGSVGVSIYPVGNKVVIMLTDTKTPRSLFLHLPGIESSSNRDNNYNGRLLPFSETKQTYIWTESVNTLLKKQSDGK